EPVDQVAKGLGANIVGADQPQPGQPLPVGKLLPDRRLRHLLLPIFDSVPDSSRAMLARCLMKTSTVMIASRTARSPESSRNHRATGAAMVASSADSDE